MTIVRAPKLTGLCIDCRRYLDGKIHVGYLDGLKLYCGSCAFEQKPAHGHNLDGQPRDWREETQ
jgi:hypothetical protein